MLWGDGRIILIRILGVSLFFFLFGCSTARPNRTLSQEEITLLNGTTLLETDWDDGKDVLGMSVSDFIANAWKYRPAEFSRELKGLYAQQDNILKRARILEAYYWCPADCLTSETVSFVSVLLRRGNFLLGSDGGYEFMLAWKTYRKTHNSELREAIWSYFERIAEDPNGGGGTFYACPNSSMIELVGELRKEDIEHLIRILEHFDNQEIRSIISSPRDALHLLTGKFYDLAESSLPTDNPWKNIAAQYATWYEQHKHLDDAEFFLEVLKNDVAAMGDDEFLTGRAAANAVGLLGGQDARERVLGDIFLSTLAGEKMRPRVNAWLWQGWLRDAAATLRWNPTTRSFDTPLKADILSAMQDYYSVRLQNIPNVTSVIACGGN